MLVCVASRAGAAALRGQYEPVEEFAFEEDTDGHTGDKYTWMNAAYAMGANINRAFKEYGWTVQIRGVESGGEVIICRPIPSPPMTAASTSSARRRSRSPIVARPNCPKPGYLDCAPQEQRQSRRWSADPVGLQAKKFLSSLRRRRPTPLSARIPYMFAVSRFTHYLKCMVRDKIGSNREKDQLEKWLNSWITPLCRRQRQKSSEEVKVPANLLATTKVTIIPTRAAGVLIAPASLLRPHFQLEGMDIGMSLVASLPEGKA